MFAYNYSLPVRFSDDTWSGVNVSALLVSPVNYSRFILLGVDWKVELTAMSYALLIFFCCLINYPR